MANAAFRRFRASAASAIVLVLFLDFFRSEAAMDLGLGNKVVLITGGSKGIGLACARAFAQEGAKVAIVSRDPANLARAREQLASEGLHVHLTRADLHEAHSAADVVEEVSTAVGPIDILINSAGAARRYDPELLDAEAFKATMEAKYFPYIYPQQEVLRRMVERIKAGKALEPGAIVNIIGMGGKYASDIHIAGGAANAALMLATVGLAHYHARYGIRINAINPGATLTERLQEAVKLEAGREGSSAEETLARGEAKVPLGRYAKPEEIADVALFLASRRASYVTGALVPMDGCSTPVI
jgi:NAD(P)-dependent dehydrogenase (short-subunit alcohol dehydrogenase family)